jgi:hypothetical protein
MFVGNRTSEIDIELEIYRYMPVPPSFGTLRHLSTTAMPDVKQL